MRKDELADKAGFSFELDWCLALSWKGKSAIIKVFGVPENSLGKKVFQYRIPSNEKSTLISL